MMTESMFPAAVGGARARTPAHLRGIGPPVVLLHGFGLTWSSWAPVVPLLEETHTVFAPTLAGHRGGPPLAADSGGIRQMADAVERQLDELGWQRAHVVGNSLGGWLAVELAQRGRAESVVLFSPAGAYSSRWGYYRLATLMRAVNFVGRQRWIERLVRLRFVRYLLVRKMSAKSRALDTLDTVELLRDMRACTALDGLLRDVRSDGPLAFSVPIDVPVLIAWARRDRTTPWRTYGRPFAALLPHASQSFLAGVGHVPMNDDPALVVRTILSVTHPTGLSAMGRNGDRS